LSKSFFQKTKILFVMGSIIASALLLGDFIPVEIKSFFYGLSLTIKSALVFILPLVIFSFLFNSLISLRSGAAKFILLLLGMVFISNSMAIMFGYTIAYNVIPNIDLNIGADTFGSIEKLTPSYEFLFPKIISNEPAIISAIITGLYYSVNVNNKVTNFAEKLNRFAVFVLRRCFLPILPLFIFGFVLKLQHEEILGLILTKYFSIFLVIVCSQLLYTLIIFAIAAKFSVKKMFQYLVTVLPSTIAAFTTISSAATMPITIMCAEKNLNNAKMARTIIPATANIHTLGSAFGVTILSLGTLAAFDMPLPGLEQFALFGIFYAMAKFAVAGIPGGVIIVVSPLLETYLGFTPDMVGLITALYILFDPFGTATNVTCNGAFAIIFSKIYKPIISSQEDNKEAVIIH